MSFAPRYQKKFEKSPAKHPKSPLDIIITRLGITRFLTTNYDLAIENAFAQLFDLSDPLIPKAPHDKQFTASGRGIVALSHDPRNPEALIQFALAAPGYECGVFHLHGCHNDPKSMIISEGDYQRMYLADDPPHRSYREALNLAFSANPILFLGFGMRDPELLRPLQQFVSSRQYRGAPGRPLFALLPHNTEKATKKQCLEARHFLRIRYGVNAIFYRASSEKSKQTDELVAELENITKAWQRWWTSWQRKPPVRLPVFNTSDREAMIHHRVMNQSGTDDADRAIFDFIKDRSSSSGVNSKRPGPVVILGGPGAGKGSLGQRLVESQELKWLYRKRFFATTHFTNDLLSLVEAAARHFATGERGNQAGYQRGHPIERLAGALKGTEPKLLVIGGGERLLESTGFESDIIPALETPLPTDFPPPAGPPASAEISRLLRVLKEADCSYNTIVLTSAIRPLPFKDFDCRPVSTSALKRLKEEFQWLQDDETIERLHHAVRGHAYVLGVVGAVLHDFEEEAKEAAGQWIKDVVCRISSMDFPRRPGKVIERVLDYASKTVKTPESALRPLLRKTLQCVAVFTTPAPVIAIYKCLLADMDPGVETTLKAVKEALDHLVKFKLLMEIEPPSSPPDGVPGSPGSGRRYTAHTVVRTQVLHDLGGILDSPGEPQRFELNCFGLGRGDTQPVSHHGHKIVTSGSVSVKVDVACFVQAARWISLSRSVLPSRTGPWGVQSRMSPLQRSG